jgi:hypothetical protein
LTRRRRFLPVLDPTVEVEATDDGMEICYEPTMRER